MDTSNDTLRALLDAASPGPWRVDEEPDSDCVWGSRATVYDADGDKVCADTVGGLWAMSIEDARLIALAPALASEVIRLRARAALEDTP